MSNLTIYSASAGSGKTFNLVVEYVSLLMKYIEKGKELGFKSILAVTFTNASTKEMKDRIIDVLLALSLNKENPYLSEIKKKTSLNQEQITEHSNKILMEIIHNYSFFNISTIDSFFQLVLRNMAKELGVANSFSIILDDNEYNIRAVKNLIQQSKENTQEGRKLSQWLYKYFLKRQEDNQSWNFSSELEKTLDSLSDTVVLSLLDDERCSIDNLVANEKKVQAKIKKIRKQAQDYLNLFIETCNIHNLTESDFKGGKTGVYYKITHHLTKLEKHDLLTKPVNDFNNGKEYLKEKMTPSDLAELIENIDKFLQTGIKEYNSCYLFFNNIYPLGVIKQLYNEKTSLLKEDDAFVLGNTKQVLRGLSLQEDNYSDKISFIYEKIGNYLESIMIDEFQDTSSIDWYNLYALIRECLSTEDGKAFIFGDIKQSIYRWNDGDWRILYSLTQDKSNNVIDLKKNFRTFGNIVDFNNSFFSYLLDNYSNQKVKTEYKDKGSVRIEFLSKDDDMLERTINEIDYYIDKGYKVGDIAVLCRNKKDITTIAERLKTLDIENEKTYKYNPISDDAFVLSSSGAIKLLVSAMRFLADKKRKVSEELITKENPDATKRIDALRERIYSRTSLLDIVSELADILNIDDTVFLPAFYDNIKNYIINFSGTLNDFLDYWDSELKDQKIELSAFDNSLRLCTIHKSKGLEYDVVIIPYLSWSVFNGTNTVWVFNEKEEMTNIPMLRCSVSELENTCFHNKYEEEKAMQRIDNNNLLYVAFTRAKKHMSIIGVKNKKHKEKGLESNVGEILYNYLESNSSEFMQKDSLYLYKNKEVVYYKQEDNAKKEESSTIVQVLDDKQRSMQLNKNALLFSTPSDAERYFVNPSSEHSKTKREFGIVMHGFISGIITEKDLASKDNYYSLQYQQQWQTIKDVCRTMLDYSREKHWFDGSFKVINERNILSFNQDGILEQKRPDRIMIKDGLMEIVDYKFAKYSEQNHKKYSQQVKEYEFLLSEMGYKNIKTYLWYVDIDDMEDGLKVNQEIILVK